MKLDNEEQRQILLQLIAAASVPGSAVEKVAELKRVIAQAELDD
jgi:hypothetical protein